MKVGELQTHGQVLAEQLQDPAFRAEWERTALARAVATRLVTYRAAQGLSQAGLARRLGLKQPAVARLERGEHTPSLETLRLLSRTLGMEFLLDIAPAGRRRPWLTKHVSAAVVLEEVTDADGGRVLVAAS
jgi:transcriptional regulator with XRE-family HTH domain